MILFYYKIYNITGFDFKPKKGFDPYDHFAIKNVLEYK